MTASPKSESPQQPSGPPYPRGVLRLLFRLPIFLFRLHLGGLLGGRFLMIEHHGRKTGRIRSVIVEVVDHDPADGSYVVNAGWGKRSDWYRNILADPHVHVTVGARRFAAVAVTLSPAEAERRLRAYAEKHPLAFRELSGLFLGRDGRSVEEKVRLFSAGWPFVQFTPADSAGASGKRE
jgi:deazaflavin-dependent oxidoreductase (nitroreductase family)